MWKNIKTFSGVLVLVIIALFLWFGIVGGVMDAWWAAVIIPIIAMGIYYFIKLKDNCFSYGYDAKKKRKKVEEEFYLHAGEVTIRIISQVVGLVDLVLIIIGLVDSFDHAAVVLVISAVLLVFSLLLSSYDYSIFKTGGEFFETKRYSYTSSSTYDVKYDDKKKQINVSPHTESGVDFDGMRIVLFVVSLITNIFLPVVGLLVKKSYANEYCNISDKTNRK